MKKQHPSWQGIVPCFESGREYLDWIQNRVVWQDSVPEEYESYFLEIANAVRHQGYEHPVTEKKMCRDKNFGIRAVPVTWDKGILCVSTQWSVDRSDELMEKVNAQPWGIKIEKIQ